MTSEESVKDEVLNELRSIHLQLGFQDDSWIHDRLLEFYGETNRARYLYADTHEGKMIRAWAVDVAPLELDLETFNRTALRLRVVIEAYYDLEESGAGRERLREHLNLIINTIKAMNRDLNSTVSLIRAWTITEPQVLEEAAATAGEILQIRMELDTEIANASFS